MSFILFLFNLINTYVLMIFFQLISIKNKIMRTALAFGLNLIVILPENHSNAYTQPQSTVH